MAYSIGIDYGTLSGRAVLVELATGAEAASAAFDYPHAVMDTALPDGTPLGPDWALQHPQDYLDVLEATVPALLRQAGVPAAEVVGIGIDCTSTTALPALADGTPLCFLEAFRSEPHAWMKLWKHHAAQGEADRLTRLAAERGEPWLASYGGRVSSEWSIPKLWQILNEAPQVYAAMGRWVEANDWLVWQLTGCETHNSCSAGYKALYRKGSGYPSEEFFRALDPRFAHAVAEKLGGALSAPGERAGGLCAAMAQRLGLCEGTAVAVGNVDAHVCVPAVGITRPGAMLAIMGTSTCHMLMGEAEQPVPGICGVVEDGILPGLWGYEAGQSCVGDGFAWYIDNCLPGWCLEEAARLGQSPHEALRARAAPLRPGESGVLALDWWNGSRSPLADADLSGLLLGLTLQTRPWEIYRALIEATAYGTRLIVENYRERGVPVHSFTASGGISCKDPMTMQIYADVLGMPVHIAGAAQGPAYGSALYGAVAAGHFGSIAKAAQALGKTQDRVYTPIAKHVARYDRLYAEYHTLHDSFGRGGNDVMKRLKRMKQEG